MRQNLTESLELLLFNDLHLVRRHVSPLEHRRLLPLRARRARRPARNPEAPPLRECVLSRPIRVLPTDLTSYIIPHPCPANTIRKLNRCFSSHPETNGPVDPMGHAIAMGTFGFAGYWAYHWDQRAAVLLATKRAEIAERRGKADGTAAST